MTMAGELSVTPVGSYIHTYVFPNEVRFLSRIVLIRILFYLVTLLSTILSSSRSIMVHMTSYFQEFWSFVNENSPFETMFALKVKWF